MAHIQTNRLKLWKPQSLIIDKISSQKMFIDNIDLLESFGLSVLNTAHTPVQSIDELRAIDTSDILVFNNGMTILVKSNGLYFFDRGRTDADDGKLIIAPANGSGRWVSDKIFLSKLAFKDSLSSSDVGLGNVPNVTTNDQTPTYTQASALTNLVSGEKLSVSFGKIMKAIADLSSHLSNKSNPHTVTKAQVGLGSVDNTSDANKPVSTAQATAIADAKSAGTTAQANMNTHIADTLNPHSVTKAQISLGNVDNTSDMGKPVSTAQATAIADAKSAGTVAQTNLNTHTANKSNPHAVTKEQVGLGNVANVSVNDQTPTYTQASTLTNIVSGEKLSVSLGKIMRAITNLTSHLSNKDNPHAITKTQVGLGNVDNTSDMNKPISTAMQTALDGKASVVNGEIQTASYTRLTGFTILNGKNLNDIKYAGQYGVGIDCANRPVSTGTYDMLEVVMYSSHWLIQRYYVLNTAGVISGVYYRTYVSDLTWSAWKLYNINSLVASAAVAEIEET